MARSMTIGTSARCDVRVHDDPYVSDMHARVIRTDDDRFWIEDLGSMNGTWIQRAGVPAPTHPALLPRVRTRTELRPGDTVWISRHTSIPWSDEPTEQGTGEQ